MKIFSLKSIIAAAFTAFSLVFAMYAQAISGACSYHGGVDCNYKSVAGNAICNDGWESSVAYSAMAECNPANLCPKPITKPCSENYQAGLMVQAIQNGSAQYTPSLVEGKIQTCKNQDAQYRSELSSYNSCVNRLLKPQIYPTRPEIISNSHPANSVSQNISDSKTLCMKWQMARNMSGVKPTLVIDGICCSKEKGIEVDFVKEYPGVCNLGVESKSKPKEQLQNKSENTITKPSNIIKEDASVTALAALQTTRVDSSVGIIKKKYKFISFLSKFIFLRILGF